MCERVCTKCGVRKPVGEFYENRNWRICKSCHRLQAKANYEANREARLKYQREYNKAAYAANKDERRAYGRKYYHANKEALLKVAKEYRKTPEWAAWKKKRQELEKERRAAARPARLAAHSAKMQGVCPACGVVFERTRRRKKYCSAKCISDCARNSALQPHMSTTWVDALKHASFLSYQRAKKQNTFSVSPFVKSLRVKADLHNKLARTRTVSNATRKQESDDLGWIECMRRIEGRARRVAIEAKKRKCDPWRKRLTSIARLQNKRTKRIRDAGRTNSQCG